jgi:hypothetical protein
MVYEHKTHSVLELVKHACRSRVSTSDLRHRRHRPPVSRTRYRKILHRILHRRRHHHGDRHRRRHRRNDLWKELREELRVQEDKDILRPPPPPP